MGGDTTQKEFYKNKGAYPLLDMPGFQAQALMNGLNALREAGKLFDVSLIVEGQTFKAHRVVLAACSDYFCAMFTDPMREARQFEITLEGVSARGIQLILEYIYTSKLELNHSNIQDVLSVSTHIQMQDVVDACSVYLEYRIDLENCIPIVSLAELYTLNELKKRCYRYLCAHLSEFAETSDFLNLSWDQMNFMLACNNPVDCCEERILEITLHYCLANELKVELARLLLGNIRFDGISKRALRRITNNINQDEKISNNKQNELLADALKKFICAELHGLENSLSRKKFVRNLDVSEKALRDILVNSRGMEMTLVKIGGFIPSGLTNEISCYFPLKRKWEFLTAIPHIEQCNYGTAVLGNDLYVVGGSYDVSLKEYTHPFGFCYCPLKNKWKTIAPIQADRCLYSLNAVGKNYLYAVGGVCELNDINAQSDASVDEMLVSSNCERYDAFTDKWEYMPALPENRSQHAGVVLGEKLYISGGINRSLVLSTLWCFDTTTETWSKLASMKTPRADHTLIEYDGDVYACGGWYEDENTELRVLVKSIDVYHVDRDEWSTIAYSPCPRYYSGVAAVGHKIFFVGGLLSTSTINRSTSFVESFDLRTHTWSIHLEYEYPQEVWECTCTAFFVPTDGNDLKISNKEHANDDSDGGCGDGGEDDLRDNNSLNLSGLFLC